MKLAVPRPRSLAARLALILFAGLVLAYGLSFASQFYERYQSATGIEIDEERCRYYQLLYAMRSAAFWMSAAGLYADGRNTDLRLARTEWSVTVALERAAQELGY